MNPVKLILGLSIGFIGCLSYLHLLDQITYEYYESTHAMTDEQMTQICIEEGIPL